PGDYSGTMLGLKDGSIDFGFLPAILFLRAQDDSGALPLFKTVRPGVDNKPVPAFTSVIAVRADSGINSVSDLKGKHIVAIDVSDAAGWVLPAAHVNKNGVDPSRDAKVEYRKDGPDALLQVLNKKADVAFAAKNDLQDAAVLKADPEAAKTLKILATIENAPLEVVAARRGLDAKVVDTFRGAFRALGDPQKGTFTKDGKTQPILGQWGISGLVEAKDGDFAALREAGKAIGIRLK
ncbi:MAG TPA: PhnD/SsuA/transferrin family substrate-binding protein, partial [Chloroflexota bacterium]|nr:PhnD/SsuA/transferrin family substrate-binding protein [Chloroflexota bacterium]